MACCMSLFKKISTRRKGSNVEEKKSVSNDTMIRYFGATICLILVAVMWVAMADMTQDLERIYLKPFFLSFIAHSMYAIFIPIWAIWVCLENYFVPSARTIKKNEGNRSWKYYFLTSVPIGVIGFLSSFLWNVSLPLTSVSGNTAICQSSCAAVFIISVCFLKESVSLMKILAVSSSIIGVFLISFGDSSNNLNSSNNTGVVIPRVVIGDTASIRSGYPSNPCFLGYLLCIGSTVLFAFFEVFSKIWGTQPNNESPMSTSLQMTGTIGAISFIFGIPLIMFLHYTGLETFENPTRNIATSLCLLGILDAIFIFLLLLSINLATPLFSSLGSMITLPASMLWDSMAHNYQLPPLGVIGVISIGCGFILFFFADFHTRKTTIYQPVTEENSWKFEPSSSQKENSASSPEEVEIIVLNSTVVVDKCKKINA